METLRGLAFFALLLLFYPVPVTLVVASALRLVLRWGDGRGFLLLAGALALPQSYIILFLKTGIFGATLPGFVVVATGLATVAGLVFWGLAVRRGGMERYWLEPLLIVAATIYLLLAVPSWIAH